jgi:hypothetical protein
MARGVRVGFIKHRIARPNKHNARSVRIDGIYFPSTGEAERYKELKLLREAGEIQGLEVHPRFPIVVSGTQVCFVVLDFLYVQKNGLPIWEDFKGHQTSESKLRHKLFEAYYGHKITITRKAKR